MDVLGGGLAALYGAQQASYAQRQYDAARQQAELRNLAAQGAIVAMQAQAYATAEYYRIQRKKQFDSRKEEVMDRRMSRRRGQIWKRNWTWVWQVLFWLTAPVVAIAGVAAIYRACAWVIFT